MTAGCDPVGFRHRDRRLHRPRRGTEDRGGRTARTRSHGNPGERFATGRTRRRPTSRRLRQAPAATGTGIPRPHRSLLRPLSSPRSERPSKPWPPAIRRGRTRGTCLHNRHPSPTRQRRSRNRRRRTSIRSHRCSSGRRPRRRPTWSPPSRSSSRPRRSTSPDCLTMIGRPRRWRSSREIYTLPGDSFDASAFEPALTPSLEAAVDVESPALDAFRADLDRLRADRESVEVALTEARAAQRRAELAAEEASARARKKSSTGSAKPRNARAKSRNERARKHASNGSDATMQSAGREKKSERRIEAERSCAKPRSAARRRRPNDEKPSAWQGKKPSGSHATCRRGCARKRTPNGGCEKRRSGWRAKPRRPTARYRGASRP